MADWEIATHLPRIGKFDTLDKTSDSRVIVMLSESFRYAFVVCVQKYVIDLTTAYTNNLITYQKSKKSLVEMIGKLRVF